ncbi:MAG: hypothetical protein JSS72_10075 [Armatimonadetes bacterium]|nr:hypothetical protein [Armatimonadota bacterium]
MTANPTIRKAFGDLEDFKISRAPVATEFVGFAEQDAPESYQPEVAEGSKFEAVKVSEPTGSGITHFLDGAQRQWSRLTVGFHPIVLAHTSAAVLVREERNLRLPSEDAYRGGLAAYGPDRPAIADRFGELGIPYVIVQETEEKGYNPSLAIGKRREAMEREIGQPFKADCLLVDGGIGWMLEGANTSTNYIGLVKSHKHRYFKTVEEQAVVLGLRAGERTRVFNRPRSEKQGGAAYSFYMRLHAATDFDPLYGLVRIELAQVQRSIEQADEIAGWLMAETAPLSLPDPRYHCLIYPIRMVEQYLRSRQPSDAAIAGILG